MNPDLDQERINILSNKFRNIPPQQIIEWAVETFWPDVAMSSSFQTHSVPLLHMVSQIKPEMRILFLDTGFHFPETLEFKENLRKSWGLNIVDLHPKIERKEIESRFGKDLFQRDPDLCCFIHKVEPLAEALRGLRAWITGIRQGQTAQRAQASALQLHPNGLVKVNPLLPWTREEVWEYIKEHDLPLHPLYSQGYLSIGCAPCTQPVNSGEDERAGRWIGSNKTECGLHTVFPVLKK
ncbi:MAG: phosphoadenylyl-sulfate reductase [Anaerolineales bacterium]